MTSDQNKIERGSNQGAPRDRIDAGISTGLTRCAGRPNFLLPALARGGVVGKYAETGTGAARQRHRRLSGGWIVVTLNDDLAALSTMRVFAARILPA